MYIKFALFWLGGADWHGCFLRDLDEGVERLVMDLMNWREELESARSS